jgi:hypothetical protein
LSKTPENHEIRRRKLVSGKKISLVAVVLLATLLVTAVKLMSADDPTGTTLLLPLSRVEGAAHIAAAAALETIEANAEVATLQPVSGGLRLTVTYFNHGDQPVRFIEPIDTTSIQVLNADGWPIEVPRPIPQALDDRPRSEQRPVKVIVLAPGETHRLPVSVTQILPPLKDQETDQAEIRTPYPIPAGTYRVSVTTTLVGTEGSTEEGPPTYTLESETVTVRLTAAALP